MGQELAFHLEQQKAEYISAGMAPSEAESAAKRLFGSEASFAEQCRDQRGTRWLEDLIQDASYARRTFLRSPAFAATATLTLALGIGATTTFFSIAYGILFRPLPYPAPDRLIAMDGGIAGIGAVTSLRDLSHAVDYAGYLPDVQLNLQFGGEASRMLGVSATSNLLRVLGVHAARGRWFKEVEEFTGSNHVAVLSERTWRQRFGSDPWILGRRIILNEASTEIIGIMPEGFTFPKPAIEVWVPIVRDPRNVGTLWGSSNLWPMGRLHDRVSLVAAQSELPHEIDRIRGMFPWRMPDAWGVGSRLLPLAEREVKAVRPKLLALAAGASLLLLIACGNVANLLLARTVLRAREISMREALGASRNRILRQLITESLLLVFAGGVAGSLIAAIILKLLPWFLPADTPRISEISLQPVVVAMALASMLVTVLLFGAVPLFRVVTPRRGFIVGRSVASSKRSVRLSLALIGVELALATTLLIAAGLMGRTLWQLTNVDSGIHATNVISAQVSVGPSRCPNSERCLALLQDIGQKLLTVPGARRVNWSNAPPLSKDISAMAVEIRDLPKAPGAPAYVNWQTTASPGYFRALGIPLIEGRYFNDADRLGSLPVMILSQATARRFWPHGTALGKSIRPMSDTQWRTVVGVVADVSQYSLTGFPYWIDGVQYLPLAQFLPQGAKESIQFNALIESSREQIGTQISAAIRERFPDIVVSRILPLESIRSESIADQRSMAWLLTLFAVLGLLLGVVGVYGVISHRAIQRTREIGIRIALGASSHGVIAMILGETLAVSLIGIAAGAGMAFWLTRFLRSLLFGVTNHDPLTLAVSPALLLSAALLAATIPGWRASRIDPALTLRQE